MPRNRLGGAVAERLLGALREASRDAPGVTRDSYGAGEQRAHDIVRSEAERLGALIRVDAAGNLYMTRPGRDGALPALFSGSHLDSVPHGGNYDGAAGVVAGLALLAELSEQGVTLRRDLTVMAIRAEEAAWFPLSYPGAEAAFGRLPKAALDQRRSDTSRTLAEHMREAGCDVDAVWRGDPQLSPSEIAAFVELHIEQGPRLTTKGAALGIVTAINGGFRYPAARCLGAYAHSGAEPRFSRHDSVLGFADLVQGLERLWDTLEAEGHELTITFGRVESDPAQHGGSRVIGELGFSLDVRCEHGEVLGRVEQALRPICAAIAQRRGVSFDLGPSFGWDAARMDGGIASRLQASCGRLGLKAEVLCSGAGHDTAVFAKVGVPSGMVFVRNANGSHNPDEHLEIDDLGAGIALLFDFVTSYDT